MSFKKSDFIQTKNSWVHFCISFTKYNFRQGKKGQFEREDIPAKRLPVISDFYKAFELQKNLVCETAVPIDSKR